VAVRGVSLAVVLTLCGATRSVAATPYDGVWQTTLSCASAGGGLGYSYRFDAVVRDGLLHGLHGREGEPGYLTLDGPIKPDGEAKLYAQGKVGSPVFVPGRETPRGTDYGFDIEAHFHDGEGTGERVEGRPCTLVFEKR
jgi:hypothetical protein